MSPLIYLDYAIDSTLTFESATPITGTDFQLKFGIGDIRALVLEATVEASVYKMYYLG